jgi:hypothetical protein
MSDQFKISRDEAMILKDALYRYREENRLGGDELSLLRRVSIFLGATEEEANNITS